MGLIVKKFDELTTGELYEILKSRSEVFMLGQKIYCQDMDDVDYASLHCFYVEEGRVAAYLRAFPADGKGTVRIGRVLTLNHGNGLGRKLMEESVKAIRDFMDCRKISVDAQKQAIGFYEKMGFKITSGEFLEEGVVHVKMEFEI